MIGPNVIQAVINKTGNNWQGFPFLFAQCFLASVVVFFWVDVKKGRADAVKWSKERRGA
jgi:Vacuole effluxer Atg22 like